MLNLGDDSENMHREVGAHALRRAALLLTTGEASRVMGGTHFESRDALIVSLDNYIRPGDVVLVKASHALEFEKITEALKAMFT